MITRKSAFTIEADIHGMTVSEAKKHLKSWNTADSTIKEIDVIHGYSNGQALQNMVRKDLKHKRIAAKILSLNQDNHIKAKCKVKIRYVNVPEFFRQLSVVKLFNRGKMIFYRLRSYLFYFRDSWGAVVYYGR